MLRSRPTEIGAVAGGYLVTMTPPTASPVPAPGTPVTPTSSTIRIGALDISFDDRVLRPRPWTAAQSDWAAELLLDATAGPVLELCSGAGHIGLLAVLDSDRHLVAVDADPVACEFGRVNAAAAGLSERVEIRQAPLAEALRSDERFPLILADPPWVPSAGTGAYPTDPLSAIDGGDDGLALARQCLEVARTHLDRDGVMLLQLGSLLQAGELADELREALASSRRLVLTDVRRPDPSGVVACVRAQDSETEHTLPEK